jgi:Zn-dependent protease with chaperone function
VSAEHRVRHLESRRLYRWLAGLGFSGLGVCALVLAAGVHSVRVSPGGAPGLDLAGLRFSYPVVNGPAALLLGLAVMGAGVLLVVLCLVTRQARATRRMIHSLPVVCSLAGRGVVLVIDEPTPVAFCAGWLRPRVYVSKAVLERLSEAELQAVLAHERQHGARRDPLRLAIGRVLSRSPRSAAPARRWQRRCWPSAAPSRRTRSPSRSGASTRCSAVPFAVIVPGRCSPQESARSCCC